MLESRARPRVERAILKACLNSEDELLEVRSLGIKPEHFLVDVNRYIYFAADYLWSKRSQPTPVLVIETFKDQKTRKEIEDFGGVSYIDAIIQQKETHDDLKMLCATLIENYTKWELIDMCSASAEKLLETGDVQEVTESLSASLDDMIAGNTEAVHVMGSGIEELLEFRESNPQQVAGLEVGWSKYDAITGGARPGDLIVVVARAKCGKSALLTNWAVNLAYESGLPILYFDTEMTSMEQQDRILAILSGVPYQELLSGKYVNDEKKTEAVRNAVQKMKSGLFHHVYMPNFNLEEVKAIAKKYKRQHDVQAIFFDYIKIPSSGSGGMKNAAEYQLLGFLTTGLKELAGTLDIPIWTAAQENRVDADGTNKSAANVGGSDRILQFCTKLMFLYRKDKFEEEALPQLGNRQLYIAFQRAGTCDAPPINLKLENESLRFSEVK